MKTLGIITARGGSKGVPRKNIRLLAGKPLLQYTAEAALAAKRVQRVVLTTDDAEIAEVGRRCGLDVPFLRPPELARDDTPTLPVLQHAVRALEAKGDRFDAICLLQPTHPLRRVADIDACIALLEEKQADSVVEQISKEIRRPDDIDKVGRARGLRVQETGFFTREEPIREYLKECFDKVSEAERREGTKLTLAELVEKAEQLEKT